MKILIVAIPLILFLSGCQNFDGAQFMKNFGKGLENGSSSYQPRRNSSTQNNSYDSTTSGNLYTDKWGYTYGNIGGRNVNCYTDKWGYTQCN